MAISAIPKPGTSSSGGLLSGVNIVQDHSLQMKRGPATRPPVSQPAQQSVQPWSGPLPAGSPAAQMQAQQAADRARIAASGTPDDIQTQAGRARELGANQAAQGQSIFAGQQATAAGFNQQGAAYNPQSVSITGAGASPPPASPQSLLSGAGRRGAAIPGASNAAALAAGLHPMGTPTTASLAGMGLSSAGKPAPAPSFRTGTQVTGGNMGSVANVDPSQLGGYGSAAGGLGGGYQVGGVGDVAGRLGAAPMVGNVGDISTGAAPGAVAGSFGDMGMSSADQAGMMARLQGFLDGPQGPSMAEAQLKQAQADNIGQMIGLARSGRGGAGAQASALSEAMSQGSALASDTAGQLATLRAQEEDMLKNRQLSAIGLGGEMSTAARGQDLSFRGQNLQAAQGDQSTALGARGQDLSASMANQATQTQLEGLRAQTALGARGQDLSALQGDQSTALGVEGLRANTSVATRGQDLSALQADLQAQIAARGQNLSALQGNQQTGVTTRGQNIAQEANVMGTNTALRGQDLSALTSDADRNLAAQQLALQGQLGFGQLGNQATGMGLDYMNAANQRQLMSEGMAQDATSNIWNLRQSGNNTQIMADAGLQQQAMANQAQPGFWEKFALAGMGAAGNASGGLLANPMILSDETAKTDISPLDAIGEHLRGAPGYRYRYKPGSGEDPEVEHAGPMAQDLERGPFGRSLVSQGRDGFKRVNVGRLSLVNHAALSSMRGELDRIKEALSL